MENNTQREANEWWNALSSEWNFKLHKKYYGPSFRRQLIDSEVLHIYLSEHPQPANQTSTPMEGYRQELFNYLRDEHGLIFLENELQEVERIVLASRQDNELKEAVELLRQSKEEIDEAIKHFRSFKLIRFTDTLGKYLEKYSK